MFVNVINTASAHVRVSRLTFGLCLNSLSLTAQQHGTPLYTHTRPPHHPSTTTPTPLSRLLLIVCHRSPVTSPHVRDELDCPTIPTLTLSNGDLLKDVPPMSPTPPCTDSCVYQPVQIKLEETFAGLGEVDGKINAQLSVSTRF